MDGVRLSNAAANVLPSNDAVRPVANRRMPAEGHGMRNILIVDDDITLCELLKEFLHVQGFEVSSVHNGEEGLVQALSGKYALLVLDRAMPQMNCIKFLHKVRSKSNVPIIIISSRYDELERIKCLETGADDYLYKPFNPRELAARIRGIFRRAAHFKVQEPAEPPRCTIDDIEIDRDMRMASREGRLIKLTSSEFEILQLLLNSRGRILSREEISLSALGHPTGVYDRSVDVHISNLRRKLKPHFNGTDRIRTVRGSGYVYTPAPEE